MTLALWIVGVVLLVIVIVLLEGAAERDQANRDSHEDWMD